MTTELETLIHQLPDGRFILAAWVPCAGEWYALPLDTEYPVSASMIERLPARGAPTFATREEAEEEAEYMLSKLA